MPKRPNFESVWTSENENCFNDLRARVAANPIINFFNADLKIALMTDAS